MTQHTSTLRRRAAALGLQVRGTGARNPEDPRFGRLLVFEADDTLVSPEIGMTADELQNYLEAE